jgi:predicted HTH domain antitoxin
MLKTKSQYMEVTLTIPDDIASDLSPNGRDLPQSLLEMAALEAYREGRITTFQMRELLGLSRMEVEGFLRTTVSISTTRLQNWSTIAVRWKNC